MKVKFRVIIKARIMFRVNFGDIFKVRVMVKVKVRDIVKARVIFRVFLDLCCIFDVQNLPTLSKLYGFGGRRELGKPG